jgi:hypothetical protein
VSIPVDKEASEYHELLLAGVELAVGVRVVRAEEELILLQPLSVLTERIPC